MDSHCGFNEVILLVDDYDVPLRYGLTHGFLEFISADMFQLFDATTSRAEYADNRSFRWVIETYMICL